MQKSNGCVTTALTALAWIGFLAIVPPQPAQAETFYCQSTKGPNGSPKYCNFLLFDRSFSRHRQIVVPLGSRRDVPLGGRYDLFCVLVQDVPGLPDNIAYRKQQCRKSDTGKEYKVPIKTLNMRRGREGYSTHALEAYFPGKGW